MLLSIRAYAQHRAENSLPGRTHVAVLKAIREGRIHRTPEGKIDTDEADQSWAQNTALEKSRPADRPGPAAPEATESDEPGSAQTGMSLLEASAIAKVWQAKQAELDYRTQLGQMVNARDVAERLANTFTMCRTKLLGVPTRVRQALPEMTPAQVTSIERFLREGLEDLANMSNAGEEDEESGSARA